MINRSMIESFLLLYDRGLAVLLYMKWKMKHYQDAGETLVDIFQETVRKHPNKLAFVQVEGGQMTFRELDEYSNKVANYFDQMGYKQGNVIFLLKGKSN